MLTSAGCNVLDYLLEGPQKIVAVDLNPLQGALLTMKLAAIQELEYEEFFRLFATGDRKLFEQVSSSARAINVELSMSFQVPLQISSPKLSLIVLVFITNQIYIGPNMTSSFKHQIFAD